MPMFLCEALRLDPLLKLEIFDPMPKINFDQGNVVVLDEAHNLINAINDAHSPGITLKQVCAIHLDQHQKSILACTKMSPNMQMQ